MRAKQRNLSQKHQGQSQHVQYKSLKGCLPKNRSHIHLEEHEATEVLSKFDEDHNPKNFSLDYEGIIGWEPYNRQTDIRNALFFQREIKPHQKRPLNVRLEPINTKDIEKCSTKDTISYLKQMLYLLRSSRESNIPEANTLKQCNGDPHKVYIACKGEGNKGEGRKGQKGVLSSSKPIFQKQNEYNDAEIISQLKHGLNKLPVIHHSKKSTISIRLRKGSKFTLDKLLI